MSNGPGMAMPPDSMVQPESQQGQADIPATSDGVSTMTTPASEARLQDIDQNPGMDLLLSLSDKLGQSGPGVQPLPSAFNFPPNAGTGVATSDPAPLGKPKETVETGGMGMGRSASNSTHASLSGQSTVSGPDANHNPAMLQGLGAVDLTQASMVPGLCSSDGNVGMPSTTMPLFEPSFSAFDHQAHLNSIASAASATAANQFPATQFQALPTKGLGQEAGVQSQPMQPMPQPGGAALRTVPEATLSPIVRQVPVNAGASGNSVPAPDKDAQTTRFIQPPQNPGAVNSGTKPLNYVGQAGATAYGNNGVDKMMQSTPAAPGVPSGANLTTPSSDMLSYAAVTASGQPQQAPTTNRPSKPEPTMPLSGEDVQQKAIEEVMRKLNAQNQMAQTAALQHQQQQQQMSNGTKPQSMVGVKPPGMSRSASISMPVDGRFMSAPVAAAKPMPGIGMVPGDVAVPAGGTKRSSDVDKDTMKRLRTTKSEEEPRFPSGGIEGPGALYGLNTGGSVSSLQASELQRSASMSDVSQKRFKCPKCARAFARAYNLNTHLVTHDPDPSRAKPFPCPYPKCKSEGGRSFSRKHDLQRHVASVHECEPEPSVDEAGGNQNRDGSSGALASLGLGAPGKKFRCERCERAFVRRDALRRHHCTKSADTGGDRHGESNSPPKDPSPRTARGNETNDSTAVPESTHFVNLVNRHPPQRTGNALVPSKVQHDADENQPYTLSGFPDEVVDQVASQLMVETQGAPREERGETSEVRRESRDGSH